MAATETKTDNVSLVVPWHSLTEAEVLERWGVSPEGLPEREVAERQRRYGRNVLPSRKPPTALEIFVHQLLSPLIYILLAAGIVAIALGDFTDAAFIFAVVLLNSTLGAYQEWRAEKSAAGLQEMLKVQARVRRSGETFEIAAEELVPGDIVLLESGDRVPADLRLLRVNNLASDEAFLTGESIAAEKRSATLEEDLPVSDRRNMSFAGATITTGRGTGVVTAIGLLTEVGKIADTVTSSKTMKPPLVVRMERFAQQISYAVLGACALLALVAFSKGMPPIEVFFLAVALAVSSIPEGLPVAMTVALSIGASRMAKRNVIVRKLTAVEGLGSCTFIASDKTGTLTLNKQTVKALWLPGAGYLRIGDRPRPASGAAEPESAALGIMDAASKPVGQAEIGRMRNLIRLSMISSETTARQKNGVWKFGGDAVDVAFWEFALRIDMDPEPVTKTERAGEIPFESERAYAATFFREDAALHVGVKGAPEVLLARCEHMLTAQGEQPLDRDAIREQLDALTKSGHRVMAVAHGTLTGDPGEKTLGEDDLPPLILDGLVGLVDPPRREVRESVEKCLGAGIQVAMVTGDHPFTALAIAREVGIRADDSQVITGRELTELGTQEDDEFVQRVGRTRVFARVSPLQKLQIVESLTKLGHFIAVTGDGVNDAPALRRANIGVAMGSGTDVTKETASIIITDDNFASIEAGVEEGRFAYDNIRKVTYLLISTGLAEVLLFVAALFSNLPLPLLPVQLLWLNLVTNGIQDVALAFEGGEPGAIRRPPRKPTEGIFNGLMIQQSVVSGLLMATLAYGYFYYLLHVSGMAESEARSYVLMLMVLLQNFHVFNCRSEYASAFRVPLSRNWLLIAGVSGAQGIHLLAINTVFGQSLLQASPVMPSEWLILLGMAASLLLTMELFKIFRHGRKVAWPAGGMRAH